ncbi:hypothetical protein JMJ99_06610 [Companilactobacillus zhachilii]|uniref:hypothetical protein n=1 Tax=Companilactobacillus zhachilii TaxID=2304606 RepID=UPI001923E08F|nr:hypothetical protein [Companilactobacillus zhachilii]MBL3531037.1 hypothetical protein [Companilactobacillus zhachilii]
MVKIDTLTLSKDESYLEGGKAYIALDKICSIAEADDCEGVWLISLIDSEVFGVSENTRDDILKIIDKIGI